MLPRDRAAPLTVLCLGAHADDIEIGCGGTLLQLLAARGNVRVAWVVFSTPGERAAEAQDSAARFLRNAARQDVVLLKFRDGYFPWEGAGIKERMEALRRELPEPDLVFTHHRADRHQDHRTISDLTWNTWRDNLVLEYEIPKYDADLGAPNCYVPLSRAAGALKVATILEVFASQRQKPWMEAEAFEALMRLRGLECAAPERWAEAFHGRKFVMGL
ncbi:PIG-L deacetylase family protein [Ramlibacter rhizophilus]|uniref:PIG-L family deacetylase n=1 Tax=Ramlibacter rhizophilus TaxID=1781167 RepID=A0A4Z0BCQ1_9BURK|nr:PIG-L deacetylase family protein [Ramlibacter rhizophilus]TFY97002.1 PIG-L family deacetylase [Ramlibacter rhizophilus]